MKVVRSNHFTIRTLLKFLNFQQQKIIIINEGRRHWGNWQAYFHRSLGINRSEGANRLEGISDPPGDPLVTPWTSSVIF
jgi:hypothetical protein